MRTFNQPADVKHAKRHRVPARNTQKTAKSTLTAEEYRTKYLLGGNDSLARLMRLARMVRNARKEVI